MLCPEVWKFKPPNSSVSSKVLDSEEHIFQVLKHQYFNHHVSLTLPNTMKVPQDLINTLLEDSQYYRITKLSAIELMKKDFIDLFVKKGQLTVISLARFSEDDSLVFTPCGKLILSLTKSTYQELGIEGTFTKHSRNPLRKYLLVLDLLSDLNHSGRKNEQIVKKLVSSTLDFDVVLAWEPNIADVCPSSIACYFSKKKYQVNTCEIQFKQRLDYNVPVPGFDEESDLCDFTEWLGAFGLQCNMSNDSYISSFKLPERHTVLGQVVYLSFTGLITVNRVQLLITGIMRYMKENSPSMWISLFIQGFQDSIISIKDRQFFLSNGDQHHTLIFRSDHPTVVCSFQEKSGY